MSFKFRRRIRIMPGVTINISKSGLSTTIGPRGANINVGKRGTYLNVGIPGTGIYDRKKLSDNTKKENLTDYNLNSNEIIESHSEEKIIANDNIDTITSNSLKELKDTILNLYENKKNIITEISAAKKKLKNAKFLRNLLYVLLIGIFIKRFKNKVIEKQKELEDLNKELAGCNLDIDHNFDEHLLPLYNNLTESYKNLITCECIWDDLSDSPSNKPERSDIDTILQRKSVIFYFDNIDIIKSGFEAFHLLNANGYDLYIYPVFIIMIGSNNKIGLIDLKDLKINFSPLKFIEEGILPKDAEVTDNTWKYANMNGQPDRRYHNNYQIPIVNYGRLKLTSDTGLNEEYCFSNYSKAEKFAESLIAYQKFFQSHHS